MANRCCTVNAMKVFGGGHPESPCPICGVEWSAVWDCEATKVGWCSEGVVILHDNHRTQGIPWASIIAAYQDHVIYVQGTELEL